MNHTDVIVIDPGTTRDLSEVARIQCDSGDLTPTGRFRALVGPKPEPPDPPYPSVSANDWRSPLRNIQTGMSRLMWDLVIPPLFRLQLDRR